MRFHETTFDSCEDVILFCKKNGISKGCTGDAFVLLNFGRVLVMDEADFLKKLKNLKDTDIDTHIESIFLSSFTAVIPGSFAASKAAVSDLIDIKDALLKCLKSFKAWDDEDMSDSGVRHATMNSSDMCSRQLSEFAKSKCTSMGGPLTLEGERFCSRMLVDSERFVTKLLEFITNFYKKHLKSSGLAEDTLWNICVEIIGYILKEISTARNHVVNTAQTHPAMYFWGMLKAWQIQQRYLHHEFLDDPALSGILVRRALLRKSDMVVKLEAEVDALRKELRAVQTVNAQLKKKVLG